MAAILQTSSINHPDKSVRQHAVQGIRRFLSERDLHSNDPELKKVLKRLQRMDCPEARALLAYAEQSRTRKIGCEEHMLEYIRGSRVKEKEFYEAKGFYLQVTPFFGNVNAIVDCCAGNGLAGLMWALEKGATVKLLDKEVNPYFRGLHRAVSLMKNIDTEYIESDITEETLPETDLVISVHACGGLTDKVIEQSIASRLPFAVMPCCHSESVHLDHSILDYFKDRTDAIDAARVMHIQDKGYRVILRNIDPKVTGKNRIIIAMPKD